MSEKNKMSEGNHLSGLEMVLAEMEREIFLFEEIVPGLGNIDLKEEIFEEKDREGNRKVIVQKVSKPSIVPFIPEKCNGMAVIVMPGGAFRRMVFDREGVAVARWLNSKGIAAFVLKYRLGIDPHERPEDVSLIDSMRAIRHVRFHAEDYGIDPARIGIMGFSAGGYQAALVSTCYNRDIYENQDEIDEVSARPDFSVLCYPAISAEVAIQDLISKISGLANISAEKTASAETGTAETDTAETISTAETTSTTEKSADMKIDLRKYIPESLSYRVKIFEKYSIDKLVHKDVPKTFIVGTSDDDTTPIEHCICYYSELRKCSVPSEMHIFENGRHGFGLGREMTSEMLGEKIGGTTDEATVETQYKKETLASWPELFLNWAASKGLL